MEQVPGHEAIGKEDWVCLVMKGLYGLPQSPRTAQKKFKRVIMVNGDFKPLKADECVYVYRNEVVNWEAVMANEEPFCVCGVFVDDGLAAGNLKGISTLIKTLEKTFKLQKEMEPDAKC